ncbi:MAG TPA: hypothetical protein VG986_06425 [Pseudolabrys sp.]|nr:hypothetical protein [Pseudolabrys sp.]
MGLRERDKTRLNGINTCAGLDRKHASVRELYKLISLAQAGGAPIN